MSIFTHETQTITFAPFETVPVTEPDLRRRHFRFALAVTYTYRNAAVATIIPGDATDDLT